MDRASSVGEGEIGLTDHAADTVFACPACRQGRPEWSCEIPDHEYGILFSARYSQCDSCGTLYQTPMPTLATLAGFYPEHYHSYVSDGLVTRARLDMRIRRIEPLLDDGDAFLDFGCGNGAFLYRASEKLRDRRFFGYEISDVRDVMTSGDGTVTIVKGDLQDLWDVLPPCRLVTINHAIEHLPSPEDTIGALCNCLAEGGVIEGQTPAADSLERKIFHARWSGYHAPRHTVIFSQAGLRALLSRVGFTNIAVTSAFNPAALAVSVGAALHGRGPRSLERRGLYWLFLLGLATTLAPVDLLSGAPGIVDFRASKASA
jgi:hypothetical protein